ncbi:hypothetical protein KCP70_09250 [Salmonella enterica subsp. enterica]|nr:hypothetical protein KCP70_09250 [Salmonella enterica subsp. enterica]
MLIPLLLPPNHCREEGRSTSSLLATSDNVVLLPEDGFLCHSQPSIRVNSEAALTHVRWQRFGLLSACDGSARRWQAVGDALAELLSAQPVARRGKARHVNYISMEFWVTPDGSNLWDLGWYGDVSDVLKAHDIGLTICWKEVGAHRQRWSASGRLLPHSMATSGRYFTGYGANYQYGLPSVILKASRWKRRMTGIAAAYPWFRHNEVLDVEVGIGVQSYTKKGAGARVFVIYRRGTGSAGVRLS